MTLKRLICRLHGHRWATTCGLCEQARWHETHAETERCTRCRTGRPA